MPFKDQARRLQANKDWREKQTPEYNQWLYARRKLRFWIAESGREVLESIASGKSAFAHEVSASDWLTEVERREKEIGNAFDHERNIGVWLTLP